MAKKTVKTEVPAKAKKPVAAAKAAPVKKTTTAKKGVDSEAIRKKAEEIYYARIARGEHGTADSDWHQAEELLKGKGKAAPKKVVAKPVAKKPVAKKK